jgi:ABC-type nitrate/sulfonate/bicarbonate transport system permease component
MRRATGGRCETAHAGGAAVSVRCGAIVAEFFGTPVHGIGFRISAEIGHLALDHVWAAILIASLVGSLSYALLAAAERSATFWHPSQLSGRVRPKH